MWKLFKQLIAWWRGLWKPKPKPEDEELDPDTCQCGHDRCFHEKGRYKCSITRSEPFVVNGKTFVWQCSCKIFIKRGKNGGDDPVVPPSVDELERMFNK